MATNNTKFLSDGRKVAVIGALNQQEWIVQEIFVTTDGDEIPSGERFVTKSLHDNPIISYQKKEEDRLKKSIDELKTEYSKLRNDLDRNRKEFNKKSKAMAEILKSADLTIKSLMSENDFEDFAKVVSGGVLYILTSQKYDMYLTYGNVHDFHSYICQCDDRCNFESLKLLSLFGSSNGDIYYRINRYRDGSGGYEDIQLVFSEEELKALCLEKIKTSVDGGIFGYKFNEAIKFAESIGVLIPDEWKKAYKANLIKKAEECYKKEQDRIKSNYEKSLSEATLLTGDKQ